MVPQFHLLLEADDAAFSARLWLRDSAGRELEFRTVDLRAIAVSRLDSFFDLRGFLRRYIEPKNQAAEFRAVGVGIAEHLLGEAIFQRLWDGETPRTVRVILPGAGGEGSRLAAALARVPWEIARPAMDAKSLGEKNLHIRMTHSAAQREASVIRLGADEELRILSVFAESRASRPLGVHRERRALLRLFAEEIYPRRRVIAHFLAHGATREGLREQLAAAGGYHLIHWSGHGGADKLELCHPDGARDLLGGRDLLELFAETGVPLPQLFFLSACFSGEIHPLADWNDFVALADGREPRTRVLPTERELDLDREPGFTGTAHALLRGGVPAVLAMRFAVGDDYARELTVELFRKLLAEEPRWT